MRHIKLFIFLDGLLCLMLHPQRQGLSRIISITYTCPVLFESISMVVGTWKIDGSLFEKSYNK